jgi:hypothetical protein
MSGSVPRYEIAGEVPDVETDAETQQVDGRGQQLADQCDTGLLIDAGIVGEVRAIEEWRGEGGEERCLPQVLRELERNRELGSVRLEVVGNDSPGERRRCELDVCADRVRWDDERESGFGIVIVPPAFPITALTAMSLARGVARVTPRTGSKPRSADDGLGTTAAGDVGAVASPAQPARRKIERRRAPRRESDRGVMSVRVPGGSSEHCAEGRSHLEGKQWRCRRGPNVDRGRATASVE